MLWLLAAHFKIRLTFHSKFFNTDICNIFFAHYSLSSCLVRNGHKYGA